MPDREALARRALAAISRRASLTTIALLIWGCMLPTVQADPYPRGLPTPKVTLRASFSPEHLGMGTTMHYALHIHPPPGQKLPPAATKLSLLYPVDLGIATSGLGLSTCYEGPLEAHGVRACPRDSLIGLGTARVGFAIGHQMLHEIAYISVFSGPPHQGRLGVLFDALALTPVGAEFVFPSLVLPAPAPYGGHVDVTLPLIPVLDSGRYVALEWLRGTVGPEHIRYARRAHGRTTFYQPDGLLLPDTCPRGGFPFGATLTWEDGRQSTVRTRVKCPPT